MNDLVDLYKNIDSVRHAVDIANLMNSTKSSREAIGELLFSSTINHGKHAQLSSLLCEVWIAKRLEIECLS